MPPTTGGFFMEQKMRTPAPTDFWVDVEGVGNFRFAKRTMRDELRIETEYSRLTEGVATPTDYLALVARWMSTLGVLTVSAPAGWDIEAMDPLEDTTYSKLSRVFDALREKEGSFRRPATQGGAGPRPGDEPGSSVPVPAPVQPPAA